MFVGLCRLCCIMCTAGKIDDRLHVQYRGVVREAYEEELQLLRKMRTVEGGFV